MAEEAIVPDIDPLSFELLKSSEISLTPPFFLGHNKGRMTMARVLKHPYHIPIERMIQAANGLTSLNAKKIGTTTTPVKVKLKMAIE